VLGEGEAEIGSRGRGRGSWRGGLKGWGGGGVCTSRGRGGRRRR